MRIIAGKHKGHPIIGPKGDNTRPTTDRVRESIMSSVESITGGIEGARVADVFAGSGAMGLEALSRGAQSALFCDTDKHAINAIKKNVSALSFSSREANVIARDVVCLGIPSAQAPFDIVFFDPPYRFDAAVILKIAKDAFLQGNVSDSCLFVYEHDSNVNDFIDQNIGEYRLEHLKRKKYGSTFVDYFHPQS